MHNLHRIRKHIGLSQQALGEALGCTQGNVAQREQGKPLSSDMARKLISAANELGYTLSFDHIYVAGIDLPRQNKPATQEVSHG